MNDDFLRRARRPPPPAFADQLRERLRQQELAQPSRRRPGWKLWTISLLIGGTVLASGTYIAMKRSPSPSAPVTQSPPAAPHQPPIAIEDTAIQSDPSSEQTATDTVGRAVARRDESARPSTAPPVRIVQDHEVATILDKAVSPGRSLSEDVEVISADTVFRAFCDRATRHRPDVVFAFRPMREEEVLRCSEHGAAGLMFAKLGHVAAVIAGADDDHPMPLTGDILLRALLKRIPSPEDPSRLIDNPYTRWAQIDRSLPDRRIEVLGPKRDSPEFLVFAIAVLEAACDGYPSIRELRNTDRRAYEQICHSLREDGAYTPAALDSTFVQQRLWSAPGAIAIVDYRFYSQHRTDLFGSLLRGAPPTRESIADGTYAGVRTVHLYVTRARYERVNSVRRLVDSFLREYRFSYHGVLIHPDGDPDQWRSRPAQLTDVRLEANKGSNQ